MAKAHSIFVVVLTGGIASGKSAVSNLFTRRGVPIIDTDLIAHQIVQPGQPALEQIVDEFGPEFLDKQGCLNRKKMRNAIFTQPQTKTRLESILHPMIAAEAAHQVALTDEPWCILVVPLMAESGRYSWVDRVLVVDVRESIQIERVMARDKINQKHAESILRAQASRADRLALADDVIDNSGTLAQLETEVEKLYRKYSTLAAQRRPEAELDQTP